MRFLSLLLICCLYQFALAQTGGNNYALFFANDNYQNNSDFGNLKNPVTDATDIAQELQDMYGFNTKVYPNYSRSKIYSVLEKWQKRSFGKADQLFLFFSGHGTFWEFTKKGYFVPNTRSTDFGAYIELTDLGNIVTQIPCQHILLAVDACYSGTIDQEIAFRGPNFQRPKQTKTTERDNTIFRQLRNTSRLLITSGEKQRTPDGKKHSPFANALLTKLRAAYSYGDGLCTYQDLLSQLERVSPTPHQGELPGHEQGGFVFVTKGMNPLSPKPELDNMVFVKGGTFQMGSNDGERNETPHTVTLSDYYMARHEVTVKDYLAFTKDNDEHLPEWLGKGSKYNIQGGGDDHYKKLDKALQGDKYPIVGVSWYNAIAYCNWLSDQEGYQKVYSIVGTKVTVNWKANGYRLPTEAEWEYAGRSRGKDQKWAGTSAESQLSSYANGSGKTDGYEYTSPVGTFKANDLGLFDMSGNVWEWCWDWYDIYYYKKSTNTNPIGPSTGASRVQRGGSWLYVPARLRCASRYSVTPGSRYSNSGFRLSRAAP